MARRSDGSCAMCGKDRTQLTKLILGVHGGICPDCVHICNETVNGPDESRTDGATFPFIETGQCVMCGKPENGPPYTRLLHGARGEICLACLDLCNDILNSEPVSPNGS